MPETPLLEALGKPATYGLEKVEIDRLETHVSWLFFAGPRVYKVKKPLALDFLDASSLERRLHLCHEEVRLNRRLAPETYLGVVSITRNEHGDIRVGGPGRVIEYAVEMRRLPAHRMLDRLLERGEIDVAVIHDLAERLVRFHAAAATGDGIDEHGRPDAIRRIVEDNLGHLTEVTTASSHAHLSEAVQAFLGEERELLERRVDEGRIRDGHGDLHAGNICLAPNAPVIYDCIEFNPAFRAGDVATDLAFLAMDLDHRSFRGFGRDLVRHYSLLARDPEMRRLLPFYKLHRALVRARVASLSGEEDRADSYLHLALSYTLPPALVLTCGLPGSGKSHLAHALALPLEAALLQSDVVRKRLAGIPPEHHGHAEIDAGLYARVHTDRTYAELEREAEEALEHGRCAVVDATFSERARRARFTELAKARGVPLVLVEARCPERVALERIARRALDAHAISDADERVFRNVRDRFEAPEELPPENVIVHDATGPAAGAVTALVERLVALVGGPGRLRPDA